MRVAHARKRKSADYKRIAWCVVYLALLGVLWGVWFGFLGRRTPQARTRTTTQSPGSIPSNPLQEGGAPTAEIAKGSTKSATPLKLAYAIIREDMRSLRDRARKKYAAMLKGKRVRWGGWVSEIKESRREGFQLCVDMDVRSGSDGKYDIIFSISPDETVNLGKDRPIIFEGTITSISLDRNCIIKLDDVTIP
jgi:hypothetical protein